MELTRTQEVVSSFRTWFESGNSGNTSQGHSIKRIMEDNRRRYRMILPDAQERIDLGLSALPSTKSCSIVDNAVVDAIQEYYQTDAITFTAEDDGDVNKDHLAKWLTELFHIRAKKNAFWIWHIQSLKCGLVDGIEAAMVRWRKESYQYPDNHFYDLRTNEEISEKEYKSFKKLYPIKVEGQFNPVKGRPDVIKIPFEEHFKAVRQKKERIVADTWEIVQLKPGENILWDFKNPVMDLNRGQWCIVIVQMQAGEILNLSKQGIFDKITKEELRPYLQSNTTSASQNNYTDYSSVATDPETVDMGEYNTAEVWLAFEKVDCQWKVDFSLVGEKHLLRNASVNDLFFGGRPYDGLPVVMGCSDFELWEALGRGLPKLIAPIEDELTDHRNNINDMAKQAATGKYRIKEDADVDINSLLNDKVFYANAGDVEKMDYSGEMAVVMRTSDLTSSDIAALAPVGISDSQLVGKGNAKDTLGSVQLAVGGNDKKLNTRMLIRNITFMVQLLRITVEMIMAFETSQKMGRIAAKKAKIDMAGITDVVDGKQVIDFSQLDFDVDIEINAGLGSVPRQQKAQKIMVYHEWAKNNGIPVDTEEVDKQLKVLNGFNEDQFILPLEKRKPQTPPPPEDKLNLSINWSDLYAVLPDAAMALITKATAGAMQVTTNVKEDKQKTPEYLKESEGSPSHPVMLQRGTTEKPQADMGTA